MKSILTTVLFCFALISSAQTIIRGAIKDGITDSPLPYVNIGIKDTRIGTVSDSKGLFTLTIPENLNENTLIVFSYVGYNTRQCSVGELMKINNIEMKPSIQSLETIVLNLKAPKFKKVGRTFKGFGLTHVNFYTAQEAEVDDRLSKELGMKFNIKKDCRITGLNFNITSNDFKSVKFRVNFYSIKDGLPNVLLIEENIICEVNDRQLGWFNIDLKPYEVYLSKDVGDIAVTLQWIESKKARENSKYFSLSAAKAPFSNLYYKEKAMSAWVSSGNNLSFYLDVLEAQ
ncbi:hypothetical protein GR160_14770 [Flavobacterium sp. Sd200]|uniref:carboxypeptidase-like regulatory domain-containing protein n=1 Tax=Flavobacterium sp. Sd200 TaxID=2692211 RepID=UPI0013707E98|nr:carboxypeptidase-like regulatory domain-containing protein [Flavobacterium sp. Sd200]MXN92490.1 hypothetical protein [Flavobacterium sp. Sd200]